MAEFAIGDLVRVKGCAMVMCVESVDQGHDGVVFYTMWFDHVGALHRDGFLPLCLEPVTLPRVLVPKGMTVLPHEGVIS